MTQPSSKDAGSPGAGRSSSVLSRTLKGLALAGLILTLLWMDHIAGTGPAPGRGSGVMGAFFANGIVMVPVLMLVSAIALKEYRDLAAGAGVEVSARFMTTVGVLLLFLLWAGSICRYRGPEQCPLFLRRSGLNAIMVLCIVPMAQLGWRSVRGRINGSTVAVAASLLGLVYIILPLSFLVALRVRWGVGVLFIVLLVCKLTDVGAYYFGKMIGGPRMAPAVSPNKTWAGVFGGVFVAVPAAVVGALGLGRWSSVDFIGPPAAAVFGLTVAGVAMLGDLAESLVKRDAGVKDSAHMIGGYGGVLDMIDDVLFVAPCAYLFLAVAPFLVG